MTETIKAAATYAIAAILIVGGLLFMYFSRLDPPEAQTGTLIPLVAGFVGAAITFVFQQETQTRTARQVERSYANSQPIITTSGEPPTTTVTPQPADHA
jgi:uncharacterized membrane protein YeaQ/YmgE (transglycosylase-associated protein family)